MRHSVNPTSASGERRVSTGIRAAMAIGALALMLTACSTADPGGGTPGGNPPDAATGSGVAEAEASIAAHRAPAEFEAPGPAIDGSAADGKLVYFIANGLSLPFTQTLTDGALEGLKAAGAEIVLVDNEADPSAANRLIQQAIGRNADLIINQSLPTDSLRAPFESAKKAGIPVLQLFQGDPRTPPQEAQDVGVVAEFSLCYSCLGELQADWAIADRKGAVEGVVFSSSDVGVSNVQTDAMRDRFEELCPDCSVEYVDVLVPDWQTGLPTQARTAFLKNPDLNTIIPLWDNMVLPMVPSIESSGKTKDLAVVSSNSNLPAMELLAKNEVLSALIGTPVGWMGWGIADQALRVLTGAEPVEDSRVPVRIFDATNIADIDLSEDEGTWFGADYKNEYLSLWGLEAAG